ncbi:MAG: hypothetical protein U1E29_05385, partial [Coriobacteriia bacterium]|nr:hypothetical protein [Coriobacteriia bacterium]
MTFWASWLVAVLLATVGGWLVPYLGMRLLVPSLSASPVRRANYRNREVYLGLGLVWVFWVAGVRLFGASGLGSGWWETASGGVSASAVSAAALTVTWALLFGLVDDVFGTSTDKGFRGHLAALARGRLTTGGLKLFGIGFVALAGGVTIAGRTPLDGLEFAVVVIAATFVIALSANLVNLLDLRPGRALKGYVLMCVFAAIAIAIPATGGLLEASLIALVLLIWLVGPAL